jgi:hypothetical protein
LTRGTSGRLKPIRLSAHASDFVDAEGRRWSTDNFFINGRKTGYSNHEGDPHLPTLYTDERYGNFSYAIPVPPGSYTVNLHFSRIVFQPDDPSCHLPWAGCRVFDVTCSGVLLLHDFDIYQPAAGAFRPLVRSFHGLKPNGQGKLLLAFSAKVDYTEVRGVEVVDEAK